MGKDTPRRDALPKTGAGEVTGGRRAGDDGEEPLQARGPDPRDEPRSDDVADEAHGKPVGGLHHDQTPRVLVKQAQKHKELEKGRPKDTGRAGA